MMFVACVYAYRHQVMATALETYSTQYSIYLYINICHASQNSMNDWTPCRHTFGSAFLCLIWVGSSDGDEYLNLHNGPVNRQDGISDN